MKEILAGQYFNICQLIHFLKGIRKTGNKEIKDLLSMFVLDRYETGAEKFHTLMKDT